MYENAAVLEYKKKKIWVRHINAGLYYINGYFALFSKDFDLSNLDILGKSIDLFHKNNISDKDKIFVMCRIVDNDYRMRTAPLSDCNFDVSGVEDIMSEYQKWFADNKSSTIYFPNKIF